MLIKVTIQQDGSLQKELNAEISKISKQIPTALERVGDAMYARLAYHIYNDWYMSYRPQIYERRTDNSTLGTPLGSKDNVDIAVNGNTLEFGYYPTGEHAQEDEYPEAWEWRSGDELIERIQTGELAGDAPARPFWNNFVDDVAYGKEVMQTFVYGMLPFDVQLGAKPTDNILFGDEESYLDATSQLSMGFGYDYNVSNSTQLGADDTLDDIF